MAKIKSEDQTKMPIKKSADFDYSRLLTELKKKIKTAQAKAILTVNAQLLILYWEIGKLILEQQKNTGWGAKIIDQLAIDIKIEFPHETGFSIRNLKYMRAFAQAYPDFVHKQMLNVLPNKGKSIKEKEKSIVQVPLAQLENKNPDQFVQVLLAQIPWYHHITLLQKVKNMEERLFYMQKTIENGWSQSVMALHIKDKLYQRQGALINNFDVSLQLHDSDLVKETFKNPYFLDFLMLREDAKEKDIERGLIEHLKKFMRELGRGFAYVGNQYNLQVDGDEFFLDLLFYNTKLHCYVIFELKVGDFKAEYAGKLNFYINTVDEKIRGKEDKQTIGILLCKTPNETVVKYALKGIKTPLGVAEYEFAKSIPKQIGQELPTAEELENELEKEYEELKSPTQKKADALKEKLDSLEAEEIKQKTNATVVQQLYENSWSVLFADIIKKLQEFNKYFLSSNYYYQGLLASLIEKESINDEFVKRHHQTHFIYRFEALKKAGVESFDIHIQLILHLSEYWYGFALMGYNNQQVFFSNMYHKQLTKRDIQEISDTVIEYVTDEIEQRLEYIYQRK